MSKYLLTALIIFTQLSLAHSAKAYRTVMANDIPDSIQNWLDAELAKGKVKTLVDYNSSAFFTRDTARIIGYIKNYDRQLFTTGISYAGNNITNEDTPIAIIVKEDGRFEAKVPMSHPRHTHALFQGRMFNFYVEPGQTLAVILDWNGPLTEDNSKFRTTQYRGPSAEISEGLSKITLKTPDRDLVRSANKLSPAEFKESLLASWKESEGRLEKDLTKQHISPQAENILRKEIVLMYATSFFNYLSYRESSARNDTASKILKAPVEKSFFNFLQNFSLNDPALLVTSGFSTFVNRFEFSNPLYFRNSFTVKQKPFHDFLTTDIKLSLSRDDSLYIKANQALGVKYNTSKEKKEKDSLLKQMSINNSALQKKYSRYFDQYKHKYQNIANEASVSSLNRGWKYKDSIMTNVFELKPNLVYDIIKVRSLNFNFGQMKDQKDLARTYLTQLEKGFSHPSLIQEAEIFFHKSYPENAKQAYDLPLGKGTEIFRKIIDPFKGKMLIVDFWATTCAPCIASIKEHKITRRTYKGKKDLEFIFITADNESPLKAYNPFVSDQELVNTYRLKSDDFLYLRQLFRFNGIPRYVVINQEGQVLNDDFPMSNLEKELPKLFTQK